MSLTQRIAAAVTALGIVSSATVAFASGDEFLNRDLNAYIGGVKTDILPHAMGGVAEYRVRSDKADADNFRYADILSGRFVSATMSQSLSCQKDQRARMYVSRVFFDASDMGEQGLDFDDLSDVLKSFRVASFKVGMDRNAGTAYGAKEADVYAPILDQFEQDTGVSTTVVGLSYMTRQPHTECIVY